MTTLSKLELAKQLSKERRFDGLSQELAVDIIETLMDLIVLHIQSGGEKVSINGFGCFKRSIRKAFKGYNVRTGEPIDVAEKVSIAFKPAGEISRRLNMK